MSKSKKAEPAKINAIMHEVFVAPNKDNLKVSLLRLFWKKDNIKAFDKQLNGLFGSEKRG